MPSIKDAVDRFIGNKRYTERDHATALEWVSATRCGNADARVLADPIEGLSKPDEERRGRIREDTISYIRSYFDERPEVVLSLDRLFAELVTTDERKRRDEFFPFASIYDSDEFMVLLLKNLQPMAGRGRYTRADIAEHFLTSDRTINKYINMMSPMADSEMGAKVLGQSVEVSVARGTNVPKSTTHPVFLTLDTVELYTLVDALVEHAHDQVEGRIIRSVLRRVYNQTTDYARERMGRIEGLEDALAPVDVPGEEKDYGEDVIFDEKEGIRATVWYEMGGEERACSGYISRRRRDKAFIYVHDGRERKRIPYDSIIRMSRSLE